MLLQGRQRGTRFGLGDEASNAAVTIDNHHDLAIEPAVAQAWFNFLGFDPKATNLYLVIASPA